MDTANLFLLAEQAVRPVTEEQGYSYVWAVVFTGLAVVFLGLIILILFVWLMGKVFTIGKNKKSAPKAPEKKALEPSKPAAAPVKAAASASAADDDEIIAVIAAAVAAMGQAEGKTYKLRSVKPSGGNTVSPRSAWAMAGLQNNTRPF